MRRFFEFVLEGEFLPRGLVFTTEEIAAVAAWLPPDGPDEVGDGTEDDGAREFVRRLFGAHAAIVEEILRVQGQHHPTERHDYLQFMGTLPGKQGRGIGTALLGPMLERCDQERVPAYLDASSEHSRDFYLGRGFEVVGELPLSTGAQFWQMRRLPR
jgi:GNAT superfamily N-acetyltransferase